MNKTVKIILVVILLAGGARLGVFLYNVNRDLDDLYNRNIALQEQVEVLTATQASMMSKAEAQRLLQQQSAYYQGQLNDLGGAVNGAYYQMQQNQQSAQDAYNNRRFQNSINWGR
jgi:hypothetical protein